MVIISAPQEPGLLCTIDMDNSLELLMFQNNPLPSSMFNFQSICVTFKSKQM